MDQRADQQVDQRADQRVDQKMDVGKLRNELANAASDQERGEIAVCPFSSGLPAKNKLLPSKKKAATIQIEGCHPKSGRRTPTKK